MYNTRDIIHLYYICMYKFLRYLFFLYTKQIVHIPVQYITCLNKNYNICKLLTLHDKMVPYSARLTIIINRH